MKAPLLFVIVFMIHVMGIGGFVLMQGCATRQPIDGTRPSSSGATYTPSAKPASSATMRPGAPVMPPRPAATVADAPHPVIKEYVPPVPRRITPPPAPVMTPKPVDSPLVTVQKGDSLSKIASRHGVSTKELAAFNGLNDPNKIQIGQKIYLPGNAKHVVQTPANAPAKPASTSARKAGSGDYVVRAGDSLSKIAVQHGTTVKSLKQANGLTSDRILVGQVLSLPGGSVSSVAPPATAVQAARPSTSHSTPRMETISITPVTPTRTVVRETVKPIAPVVLKTPEPSVETSVIDQSFEYTVQEGETLRDISNAFIVSSEDILKINNLSSENAIRPGMKLKIPPSEF